MDIHSVPCITSFHPPEPADDAPLRRTAEQRLDNLDADTLLDAMELAGSEQITMKLLARLLAAGPKTEQAALKALRESVIEDLEKLIEKNGVDDDE